MFNHIDQLQTIAKPVAEPAEAQAVSMDYKGNHRNHNQKQGSGNGHRACFLSNFFKEKLFYYPNFASQVFFCIFEFA